MKGVSPISFMAEHPTHSVETPAQKIFDHTGESLSRCYQCGKCTAGCPMSEEMDITPSRMMRMLQYDDPAMEEEALRSYSVWLCLTCGTCLARCPQEIDIPGVMDFLRTESLRKGMMNPSAKNIVSFQKSFIDSLRLTGMLYEVGLVAGYKARTWKLFQDLSLVPWLFLKGKLNLLPHRVKDRKTVKKIFRETVK